MITMGTFKDEKDVIVGKAKEKIGEWTNNEELAHSGKEQAQEGQIMKEHDQKRVNELDDQNDERDARNDRTTPENVSSEELLRAENPDANKISSNDRRDADQLKHYTGIEDKL
ncbi:CsbD family protein [Enterococcus casseliflavus]|uniref:CsbD family protein n=1 Tax=Enterococcus casseliflavus TaxID=37734 RepID=UPI00188338DF|nr:CsbD family protein [Enterococcus casseliflavus]